MSQVRLFPSSLDGLEEDEVEQVAFWATVLSSDMAALEARFGLLDHYRSTQQRLLDAIAPLLEATPRLPLSIAFEVFSTPLPLKAVLQSAELNQAHASAARMRRELLRLVRAPRDSTCSAEMRDATDALLALLRRIDATPLAHPFSLLRLMSEPATAQRFIPIISTFCRGCQGTNCKGHATGGVDAALDKVLHDRQDWPDDFQWGPEAHLGGVPELERQRDALLISGVLQQPELAQRCREALARGEAGRLLIEKHGDSVAADWQPLSAELRTRLALAAALDAGDRTLEWIETLDRRYALVVCVRDGFDPRDKSRTTVMAQPWLGADELRACKAAFGFQK